MILGSPIYGKLESTILTINKLENIIIQSLFLDQGKTMQNRWIVSIKLSNLKKHQNPSINNKIRKICLIINHVTFSYTHTCSIWFPELKWNPTFDLLMSGRTIKRRGHPPNMEGPPPKKEYREEPPTGTQELKSSASMVVHHLSKRHKRTYQQRRRGWIHHLYQWIQLCSYYGILTF